MLGGLLAGVVLGLVALIFRFGGWDALVNPLQSDFAFAYETARIGIEYGWGHLYDLDATHRVSQEMGVIHPLGEPDVPSLYPPPQAWLTAPFTLLPFPLAYAVWTGVVAGCLLLAWRLTVAGRPWERAGHLVLVAVFVPVVFGLCLGQVIFLIMAGLAMTWWFLQRDREIPAGVALALLVLKPQIGVLVPLALLVAGRRRTFVAFAATCGLILGLILLTMPLPELLTYLGGVVRAGQHQKEFMVYADVTTASLQPGVLAGALQLTSVAAVLAIAYLMRRDPLRDTMAISAGLVGSLLVVPYIHYQDLTFLFLAAWLYLRTNPSRWILYVLVFGYAAANSEIFVTAGLTRLAEIGWLLGMLLVAIRGRTSLVQTVAAGRFTDDRLELATG